MGVEQDCSAGVPGKMGLVDKRQLGASNVVCLGCRQQLLIAAAPAACLTETNGGNPSQGCSLAACCCCCSCQSPLWHAELHTLSCTC